MTFFEYYQRKVASGEILEDSQQMLAIPKFQAIYDTLLSNKNGFYRFSKKSVKGLYLWGDVGIGKTFLMDSFYHFLPFDLKCRTHFLPFMRDVHEQLKTLQGIKNPLHAIAKIWSSKIRVLCFDEFLVNDIADAMILGNLLDAFFKLKICVLFTSNFAPDDLYKNGIQRELFLPAIQKIKQQTAIVHLEMIEDYRVRYLIETNYYWHPLTTQTQAKMIEAFKKFARTETVTDTPLIICDRTIRVQKMGGKTVWFDFLDICGIPRSQNDHLEIVKRFDTILVSNLISIRKEENDLARSFIQFIDVLYEAKIKLIMSAALPIEHIYENGNLSFEFKRTISRIKQMQSATWTSN
jgi:cell division protein ZapE